MNFEKRVESDSALETLLIIAVFEEADEAVEGIKEYQRHLFILVGLVIKDKGFCYAVERTRFRGTRRYYKNKKIDLSKVRL